jgi:carotenoid cleavage dioxygenase-like enzyme
MKNWKRLFNYPFREINSEPVKLLQGKLPKNFSGTLYRNSVAFLPRIDEKLGHLLDGVDLK